MSSPLNLTNNFPSRTTTGVFTGGSANLNNGGYSAQGHIGIGNSNRYGAIHVGRTGGWNGGGSTSVGVSAGFRF